MINKSVYIKVLGFALVSLVILLYLATILGDIRFKDTRGYHAMFKNVSQLKDGDPVRIAGVEVGKVDSVYISGGSKIEVDFNLDSSIDLDRTTRAVVRYKDLVGNRFLELQQAPETKGPLSAGGMIPMSQTTAALNLDDLFESFKPLLGGLNSQQINDVSTELVSVLQGEGGSVYRLLATIGSFTKTIANNDALVGDTIDNLSSALQSLDAHSGTLSDVFVQLQRLITGLNADKTPILDSLDQIQGVSTQAAALLANLRGPLRTDVDQIGALSRTLFQQRDTLQEVLDTAPRVQQTLLRLGSHGAYFNFYLCGLQLQLSQTPNSNPNPGTIVGPFYNHAARCG